MAKKKAKKKKKRSAKKPSPRAQLRAHALTYPDAWEDYPWGHAAYKVRKKIFCIMANQDADVFTLSMKLPDSNREALLLPFSEPTRYGMGKHGWVTFSFETDSAIPVGLLIAYIDEAYRAIAPKTLVKQLDTE